MSASAVLLFFALATATSGLAALAFAGSPFPTRRAKLRARAIVTPFTLVTYMLIVVATFVAATGN